jgi:DNA mismatch endonuclease, patch repair protein
MTDVMTKEQRSNLMSRVRDRDTSPELEVRRQLFSRGLRGYRLRPKLPGKPDIVYSRAKLAIFIDGCFWHGCPRCYTRPATRRPYWDNKLAENVSRDKAVDRSLKEMGWKTLHFWEHDVKKAPGRIVKRVKISLDARAHILC